ncbi:hypothetical protein HPB48_004377 [Haemaphysalis longicornis]|uniref:Ig-like domain-containing protein n=1 Tax=Haemaphysalis longicornis TaxID=44386 RepID=A0A9J6FRM1_HAELO|nr:hypothetical protein HPB48_004377 [Haemaphysalis longicornis]
MLAPRPARSSPQGLGPRLLDPLPAELRFSNSTGASLNCGALGQPAPRISWLREGAELVPLEGLLVVLPNGTLHFPPFPASQFRQDVHGTTYRCRAANLFGAVLSPEVRVRAVVEQYYEVQVYDEFTIAGNTAVLRCHVPSFVRDDVVVVSWEQKQAEKTTVVTNGLDSAFAFLFRQIISWLCLRTCLFRSAEKGPRRCAASTAGWRWIASLTE